MGMKRKLDSDFDDCFAPNNAKQVKLVPFPNYEPDNDVAMSDSSGSDAEPTFDYPIQHRFPSSASTASSASDSMPVTPSSYPSFDIYPFPNGYGAMHTDNQQSNYFLQSPEYSAKVAALLQPKNTVALRHYSPNCSQIPKLRVACSTGLSGRRTMWSHCEQCGAIQMVDSD